MIKLVCTLNFFLSHATRHPTNGSNWELSKMGSYSKIYRCFRGHHGQKSMIQQNVRGLKFRGAASNMNFHFLLFSSSVVAERWPSWLVPFIHICYVSRRLPFFPRDLLYLPQGLFFQLLLWQPLLPWQFFVHKKQKFEQCPRMPSFPTVELSIYSVAVVATQLFNLDFVFPF